MQETAGQKLPEKRKPPPFLEDMLMDFPDVNTLQTSFQSTEEKHLQWLHNLEERHKVQRMRLRNRHIAEYQKWKEETTLSIDPQVVLPHNSTTSVTDQIHESSLPVLTSPAAAEALKKQGKEFRHVLVSIEQLEDSREEGEVVKNGGSGYSSVEFAAEMGRMGVNLRKAMVDEKTEMRYFQAAEKEMVLNYLLKSDPEKYGKGKGRMPSISGTGGTPGGVGPVGMSSRLTSAMMAKQANAGIGGVGLADMYDKSKPKQPLNIKIPQPSGPHAPGPHPPGSGSRTATPLTATSAATITGDGYFSGLPSAGLLRDPRLASKPAESPKDPRLSANNPALYRNLGPNGADGGGGTGTAGRNITAASNASSHATGNNPIPSTTSFPSPSKPPPPAPPLVPVPVMSSTTMSSEQMLPPSLAVGMVPVTSIFATVAESPTQHSAPLVPGMSPVTPTFPPPSPFNQAPNVPAMAGVNLAQAGVQSKGAGVEQAQGNKEMDMSHG